MSSLACTHVCMCAHAHTCVCMCVCVHVCVRAHLSMLLSFCYFSAAVPPCLESFFPLLHWSNLGKALSPTSPPLLLNEFFSTSSFEALRAAPLPWISEPVPYVWQAWMDTFNLGLRMFPAMWKGQWMEDAANTLLGSSHQFSLTSGDFLVTKVLSTP